MELYTLTAAAVEIGCTPNRLKSWMDKRFIPDHRIHLGRTKARVFDLETIEKMRKVVAAIDQEGIGIEEAFEQHFQEPRDN